MQAKCIKKGGMTHPALSLLVRRFLHTLCALPLFHFKQLDFKSEVYAG